MKSLFLIQNKLSKIQNNLRSDIIKQKVVEKYVFAVFWFTAAIRLECWVTVIALIQWAMQLCL